MENLRELVYIISQNRTNHIELLNTKKHSKSKVNRLFSAISSGDVNTDEDAFHLLYPDADSKSAFNNLKAKLREKLLNTLFFIDPYQANHSDRQVSFFEAHKDYAAAQILLAKNAQQSAVELLKKLLKKCEHYEFSELSLMITRALCLHYSTRIGDEKRYDYYDKKRTAYEVITSLEGKAEKYYSQLILKFVNKKSPKPHLAQQAELFCAELIPELKKCTSYKFHLFTALIRLFQYTCTNDYPATLPICAEVIRFFEKKPFAANTPIQLCYHHQLVAYIQLEDYDNARQVAELSQQLTQDGTFNWFNNLEYLFLLAMHTSRFQEAYQLFSTAIDHKRFSFLPEYVQEMWGIYHAYLHLMIDLGKVKVAEEDNNFTPFRIQRFLNSIPLYSKDKQGMNIAILIVQILFYLQKGKYDLSIDRIETIEKYCSRYLMNPETIRSYYFIKLLLVIPQVGFHRTAVERHTKKYLDKLRDVSSEFSQQFHKIEIIPYELLWETTLSMLGQTIIKVRRQKSE
jgi:hypothetical protein